MNLQVIVNNRKRESVHQMYSPRLAKPKVHRLCYITDYFEEHSYTMSLHKEKFLLEKWQLRLRSKCSLPVCK